MYCLAHPWGRSEYALLVLSHLALHEALQAPVVWHSKLKPALSAMMLALRQMILRRIAEDST